MTTPLGSCLIHKVCRCGQAASRLAEASPIARPEMPSSEVKIYGWWLVSPKLAAKLRAAGLPLVQFGELSMWGRSEAAGELVDDLDLVRAIGSLPPGARHIEAGHP